MNKVIMLFILISSACIVRAQNEILWDSLGSEQISGFNVFGFDLHGRYWGYIYYRSPKYDSLYDRKLIGTTVSGETIIPSIPIPAGDVNKAMVALPDKSVLLGTTSSAIYRSTNEGETWIQKIPVGGQSGISALTVSKLGVVYCCSESLLRSTDYGVSWQDAKPPQSFPDKLLFDSEDHMYLVYLGNGGKVFKTTNHGETWSRIDTIAIEDIHRNPAFEGLDNVYIFNNHLYFVYHYLCDQSPSPCTRMIYTNLNGYDRKYLVSQLNPYERDTLIVDNITEDSSGVLYGISQYNNSLQYSLDSGRKWFETAYVTSNSADEYQRNIKNDTVQHIFYDSTYRRGWDPTSVNLVLMTDGHLYFSYFQYRLHNKIFSAPFRIASMKRCGCATATFISDTLSGVKVDRSKSYNISVKWDSIDFPRSIQLNVCQIDTGKTSYYYVTATSRNGAHTDWADYIYPSKNVKVSYIKNGDMLKRDSLDAGVAVSYEWYRNGHMLSATDEQVVNVRRIALDSIGMYQCKLFDTNGCVQNTEPFAYEKLDVKDESEYWDETISINPNPIHDRILICSSQSGVGILKMYDTMGNIVLQKGIAGLDRSYPQEFDVSYLPIGVYRVQLCFGERVLCRVVMLNR